MNSNYARERAASNGHPYPRPPANENVEPTIKAGETVLDFFGVLYNVIHVDGDEAWCRRVNGGSVILYAERLLKQ